MNSPSEALVKDPVCGMRIERSKASGKVELEGRTYFFCSLNFKDKFQVDPNKYRTSSG